MIYPGRDGSDRTARRGILGDGEAVGLRSACYTATDQIGTQRSVVGVAIGLRITSPDAADFQEIFPSGQRLGDRGGDGQIGVRFGHGDSRTCVHEFRGNVEIRTGRRGMKAQRYRPAGRRKAECIHIAGAFDDPLTGNGVVRGDLEISGGERSLTGIIIAVILASRWAPASAIDGARDGRVA